MRQFLVPGILALFSVMIIYLAMQLKLSPAMIVGHSMQPRSFPIFLMVINLVLIVVLTWQISKSPPKPIELEGPTTWISVGSFALFYIITVHLDFFIAISAVMFLLCYSWGEKRVHVAGLVAVSVPLSLFLLFDEVLKIERKYEEKSLFKLT